MRCISATTHSDRCAARTPINYYKRLLEEACPNYAYPVRHKLKDCSMTRSFMTLRSLTWGAEPDKGPNGSDAAPFPEENAVMTIFGPRISTHRGWGLGG
jgi:hypothetical protein